jgi:cyclomaltodextrinase / maltogenic alpha-amylase / neopullulanase
MNYDIAKPLLGFFPGKHLNLRVLHQQSNYHGIRHAIDAYEFANRIDHNLRLYRPDITSSQLNLVDSHDTPRFLSCASGDKDSLKLAFLFLFAYPGAPCIYYGDEIGLDGEHDPYCRKSFPWDEGKWDQSLRSHVKELIALRTQNPALRRGDFKRLWSTDGTYVFSRSLEEDTFVIGFNVSDSTQEAEVTYNGKENGKVLFGAASDISVADGRVKFKIPARSGVMLK